MSFHETVKLLQTGQNYTELCSHSGIQEHFQRINTGIHNKHQHKVWIILDMATNLEEKSCLNGFAYYMVLKDQLEH